ncbi:MAG: hypothetical protein WD770_05320 [Actinomycetota bacterium]
MRRTPLLLMVVALLAGCARASGPGDQITPDTPTPTTPGPVVNLEISCQVFYRDNVEESPDEGESVTLVSDGDVGRIERGALVFEARYLDDGFEGRALSIHVTEGDRPVSTHLYQLRRDETPVNEFEGGHGFTGLAYSYSSHGAELQHFCTARALRDQ